MLSRRESLLDNFRFIVFGSVLLIGLTVSARTVALWPIEWDPVSGVKDFRCAADDGMTAFSGALDEWRITCGVRTAEDILFRPRKGMVLIFR